MITKTIKFKDSPVMNELSKKYVVFSAIQKTASDKKHLEEKKKPSQNFNQDIVILCEQLRKRGFDKEAKSLENKLSIKKQAEVHLYNVHNETAKDILDFAHPDGDAKIAEAPYQLGEIETLESTQKKILNSLVANILNVDLKKVSQKSDMEIDPDLPSDLTDIELNENTQKKVDEINQYLGDNWPKIGTAIKQAIFSIGVDETGAPTALLSFKPENILKRVDTNAPGTSDYVSFFASKSGVSKSDLDNFITLYKNLYGENEFSPATIYNRLYQINDYWGLKQLVSNIDPKIASQFFRGSKILDKESIGDDYINKANRDERLADNPQSIWWTSYGDEFKIDPKVLNNAAENLHNVMQANYRKFIIDSIPQANQAVVSEIFGYLTPLTSMLREGNINFNMVPVVKNSTGLITSALRAYLEILNQYNTAKSTGRAIYNILGSMLLPTTFFNSISSAAISISDILKYLSDPANIINPKSDIIPPKQTYVDISEKFRTAARRLNDKIKSMKESGDTTSAELNTYIKRLNRAYNAYKIISNSINKPFGMIQAQLSAYFPKIDTFDALQAEADSWLEGTAPLATAIKMMQTIIKQSAYGDDEPGQKSKAPIKIPGQTSGGVTQSIISLSPEEKEAVQGMQLSLFTLGQYIKTYGTEKLPSIKDQISVLSVSLIRTGKGLGANATKNQFDGAWGPNTANAIKSAQIILSTWNKNYPNNLVDGQLEVGPLMKQPAVINKANDNSNIINQLIRNAFGISIGTETSSGGGGNIYDKIEQDLNESTLTSVLGKTPVTEKDLSSLPNFYQYLIENGFAKPEFVEGQEGLATKLWKNILSWFENRSQFLLGNADKAKKGLALSYRRAVNDLRGKFETLIKYYKLQDDQLLPTRILGQISSDSLKSKPFSESGTTMALAPGEKGDKKNLIPIKYRRDQTVGEGKNIKLPPPEDDTPPIGKTLDLRRTEWFDIDYSKLAYPILDLDQFTRTPATTLASMMFGGEQDTQAQYQDMIESNIPAQAIQWNRYTNEYNIYMITNGRGAWYSLSNLQKQPWFITSYPILAAKSRNPIDQFQQFLFNLSRGLHQTATRWSSETDATEEEINISQNYSGRWLRAIKLKLNQIQDWRNSK